jgi:hypothetical protein
MNCPDIDKNITQLCRIKRTSLSCSVGEPKNFGTLVIKRVGILVWSGDSFRANLILLHHLHHLQCCPAPPIPKRAFTYLFRIFHRLSRPFADDATNGQICGRLLKRNSNGNATITVTATTTATATAMADA